jgi:hypothetical protein
MCKWVSDQTDLLLIIYLLLDKFLKNVTSTILIYIIYLLITQAFDSIDRNKVLESLNYYDVPEKLISIIALTLMDTKAIMKVNKEYSSKFEVYKGVKQGDTLPAALFSIAIDIIIRKLDTRGNNVLHMQTIF